MRFPERYGTAYNKGFPETLFDGTLTSPIPLKEVTCEAASAELVGGYCSERFDVNGQQLQPFAQEYELLDLLAGDAPPRTIFVTGDAGCGKSTFLRFVFGFLRYYWEDIRAMSFSYWRDAAQLSAPTPSRNRWVVLDVALEQTSDPEGTVASACANMRRQLLGVYPNLLQEDEWAMIRADRKLTSRPDEVQAEALKRQADFLQIDDDKARDFCRMAFYYLRFTREPASERIPLVLIVDDSDLMGADHVGEVMRRLEGTVVDADHESDIAVSRQSLSIIHAVRPDTYDRRLDYHVGLAKSHKIELGRVNSSIVVDDCSKRFIKLVTEDADDLEDEITPDEHATYSIPIPGLLVPRVAQGICRAASGGFDDKARSKHVATTIIAPLGGNSLRRIKRCQKRIASSIAIENRIRAGESVSNYDVLFGLIAGDNGASEALKDSKGVGEWFPKGGHPNETFLHTGFVLGSLLSGGEERYSWKLLESNCAALMLGDVSETLARLIQFGYVGRHRNDKSFRCSKPALKALLDLIIHPAYVDLTAARILAIPEQYHRGRRQLLAADAKTTFSNSLQFLRDFREHESNWIMELQTRCNKSLVEEKAMIRCFETLALPVMSERMRFGYIDRLRGLAANDAVGESLRDVAMEMSKEYLNMGAPQQHAIWSAADLGR